MIYERLETETISGYFDEAQRVLRICYRGVISPQTTNEVYAWLGRLIVSTGGNVGLALGSIYDFRDVKDFKSNNISAVQNRSRQINTSIDLSNHPIALITGSMYQEKMVQVALKMSPQDQRKRIVRSEAEAFRFIEEFHQRL